MAPGDTLAFPFPGRQQPSPVAGFLCVGANTLQNAIRRAIPQSPDKQAPPQEMPAHIGRAPGDRKAPRTTPPCPGDPPAGLAGFHPLTVSLHRLDRKSTRLNSSHVKISYAVFCLKKKMNGSRTRPFHNLIGAHKLTSTMRRPSVPPCTNH